MEASTRTFVRDLAIYTAIVAVFWVLPPVGTITPMGMKFLGLFVAFVVGLAITPDAWPSVVTMLLFPLTGIVDFGGVIASSFGNDVCLFVMLSLVLIAYMDKSGAASFTASWLLRRKFLKGHPWRFFAMIFFICWLISTFVNAVAGMMMTWVFLYQVFDRFGYKPYEKLPTMIIFGTCVVGGLGLSTLPWGNNSIIILDAFTKMSGMSVNYIHYMGFSVPFALITIAIYLAFCRFVYKLDVSALGSFDSSTLSAETLEFTAEKAFALLSMLALVIMILIPNCLPADSPIIAASDLFGLSGKLLLIFAVGMLVRLNGKPACDFVALAKIGINWKLIMILVCIMIFSKFIGSKAVGLNALLSESVGSLFVGQPAMIFIVIVTIVAVVLTNFMVNKIVAILMLTTTLPIISTLGLDPVQYACLFTICSTIAFMLPSASQSSLILFSNTEWIRPADVFKYGLPMIIVLTAVVIVWNVVYFGIF